MPHWKTVLLKRGIGLCSVRSLGWFSYIAGWGLHFLDSFSCGLGSAFSGCWSCWIRIHPNHLIRTRSHWQRLTFHVRSSRTGPQLCLPCALKCPNPENDQGSLPVGSENLAHVLALTTPHALIFPAPRGPHLWPEKPWSVHILDQSMGACLWVGRSWFMCTLFLTTPALLFLAPLGLFPGVWEREENRGEQWPSISPAQGRWELETHQWRKLLNPLWSSPFVVTKRMLLGELWSPQALGPQPSQTQSSCQKF